MTDEAQVGLADSEPADVTLDSILDKAIDGAEQQAAEPEEGRQSAAERARDEKGRFAPKDNAAEASKEPADAVAADAQSKAVEPAPVVQPVEPPARWTAEDKAKFAAWPRDVQEAVADRYKAIEADYTRKTQEAAEIRRTAEPLLQAVQPFQAYLTQLAPVVGLQPHEMVRSLLQHEHGLRTGTPEQKYAAFANLANTYGVDLAALARGEIAQPDPTILNLRQELSELTQWKAQFEQQTQLQQAEQTTLHIESFATAKDEAGRPRFPHFERVRGVMAQSLMSGEARTLEEAYQKATAPIQEAIAEELRNRQQVADAQRKDALAKADKAAPVRSSGSQPGGATKGRDLDSLLSAAIDRHG